MEEKDERTKKYVEYQMLTQQLQELQRRIQEIANQINELKITRQAVEAIPKAKKGDEILAPLAPGIFVKAELKDSEEFHINVGSSVMVTKSVGDTLKLLNDQEAEIKKVEDQLAMQWQTLLVRFQEIQQELQ